MKKKIASILFGVLIICIFFPRKVCGQCPEYDIVNLKKIAIVFGEKDYKYANPLINPLNDAQDISDSLKKMGFEVSTYTNTDLQTMNDAIDNWCTKIAKYDVALFYYSGHGAEVNGINYLFPIDARPQGPSDLFYMAYSANKLLDRMEQNNTKFNILILDACRSNPFTKSWERDFKTSGLATMSSRGSFIAYAASPGTTASDGSGRNGTYTEGILKYMTVPDLTIDQIFTRVNSYVRTKSFEKQVPYKNSSLGADFCFSVKFTAHTVAIPKSAFNQPASGLLLSSDEDYIFMSDTLGGYLSVKDAKSLNSIKISTTTQIKPFKLVTGRRDSVYIIDSANRLLIILDSKKMEIRNKIDLNFIPHSIAVSGDGRKAYIIEQKTKSSGNLNVIDIAKNKIIKVIPTNFCPTEVIFSTDSKDLYVSGKLENEKGELFAVDIKTDKIIRSVENSFPIDAIGVSPSNKEIYIGGSEASQFSVMETASFKVIKTVGIKANAFTFSLDGKYVFAVGESEVSIIELENKIIINKLPFATTPKGVVITNDNRGFVWLPIEHRIFVFSVNESLQRKSDFDLESNFLKFKDELKKQSVVDNRNVIKEIFKKINDTINSVVAGLIREMGDNYNTIQTGLDYNYKDQIYVNQYGIFSQFDKGKMIFPKFQAKKNEDNFILSIKEQNEDEETLKEPLNNINWNEFKQVVRNFFLKRIDQLK